MSSGVQRSGDARGQLLDCMLLFQTVEYSRMGQRQTFEIRKTSVEKKVSKN